MLGAQFHVRTFDGFRVLRDETNAVGLSVGGLIPDSGGCLSIQFGLRKNLRLKIHGDCGHKSFHMVSCKSSRGIPSDGGRSTNVPDDQDHDFLQASLLVSETTLHHRMRKQGFQQETTWRLPGRWNPHAAISKESRPDTSFVGHEFLRRFRSPTIFLKVSYDGEFLLPIIVGEFAIDKLIDAFQVKNEGDYPDQFQLVRNLVEKLGYKVKMVRITERVVNTYFARIFLSKPGEFELLSIDARPSDAINVANRCQDPIHVSKQIVSTDAIRISYGIGRMHERKPTYDVSLDSAADGPDLLSEELDLLKNINSAVKEERYNDAAKWRDELMELRQSRHSH